MPERDELTVNVEAERPAGLVAGIDPAAFCASKLRVSVPTATSGSSRGTSTSLLPSGEGLEIRSQP
jgi:hypothetical protein